MAVTLQLGTPSVIGVAGEADLDGIGPLQHALEQAARHHPHLVLDLSGVTFADSTFLNALLRARDRALGEGGSVRLRAPSSCVVHVLAVTGADVLFPIVA
ncbi:STAS domain-containing protein [Streptomyces sp. CA-111067]|uniref:STAS domain-containing protein n=1 Tax=Streptomyces sp. CA-111067 TaxID=3240046 RepID=UPI003D97D548